MADVLNPSTTYLLPVPPLVLVRLQGSACITCGSTAGPLTSAGHAYTDNQGGRLGWAVVACPEHHATEVTL